MEAKFQEQEPQENDVDSPLSGDEATEEIYEPAPKKSRKGANKRVVTVTIGDGGPPSDSWCWRKYGQKPIKGSPYPRGYYRCSSSKGCPARKQVERSRLEPTKLQITYFCEHNHPLLATTKNHHNLSTTSASTDSTSTSNSTASLPAKFPPEECAVYAKQPDLEPADNGFSELAGELGWLADVGFTVMDCPNFVGPSWAHLDVEVFMPIGEEDESLFGDLGDLPESSVVLRRRGVETPCCVDTI